MKKIWLLLTLFLIIFGLLFVVKNDAFAQTSCEPPCAANEKCSWNGRCVPRCNGDNWGGCSVACGGGTQTNECGDSRGCNTQACVVPTATPIPTITPNLTPPPGQIFMDVPPGYWAFKQINILYNNGVTAGCSTNPLKYCPEDPTTRAQAAVFLLKSKYGSSYSPPAATGIFTDVPVSHPQAKWIEKLYADGITAGCSTNPLKYCPEDPTTRAQAAVFLLKSKYGSSYSPPAATGIFTDVPVSHPQAKWIEKLYADGITAGCSTNPLKYCPEDPTTRAQMAALLVKTFIVPGCPKKIQGDADCDGNVTFKDYFYYVAKKAGVTLPTTINVDFDGNGTVDANDRAIVIKTLKP
ncbi:MAG: hypothetical protein AAB441_01625 [Patescibacteria group bacterium]